MISISNKLINPVKVAKFEIVGGHWWLIAVNSDSAGIIYAVVKMNNQVLWLLSSSVKDYNSKQLFLSTMRR